MNRILLGIKLKSNWSFKTSFMGLFDIFKKKSKSTFPENEIEYCLSKAANDISAQRAFYQKLVWNHLFVLRSEKSHQEEGKQLSGDDTEVDLIMFDNGQIPVFTSVNRIYDNGVIKKEQSCISIKGEDLFTLVKGATFVLNPYSDFRKELIPAEIESLMSGEIYEQIDQAEKESAKFKTFNELFERAGNKQNGLIFLNGYNRKSLRDADKIKLEDSLKDFQQCLEIIPEHWQSMVLMAKSLQRLERHAEALAQLEAAFIIELNNHVIPMEASLEAMHLGDLEKAIFYSAASLKRKPDDFTLLGNHAMNLLVAGKDNDALLTIEKALGFQPKDPVNRNVEAIVKGVIAGKRERPTFEDAIR